MKKAILFFNVTMLSILSLYASGDNCYEEKGFTVTYLMLKIQNIELPQDQNEEDINSSENKIEQNGGVTE